MVKDSDGFKVVFEDCSLEDRKFFISKYGNVDDVANERVHCTSCDQHIGTAPNSAKLFRTHPFLGVTQCNECFKSKYEDVQFTVGDDGYNFYCKWCADGGDLLCCSKCCNVFCKRCIAINFTIADLEEFENDDNWSCFQCNKETLKHHRARHWALQNFIKKQKGIIQCKPISRKLLNKALNEDRSTCCAPPKLSKATVKRSLSVSPSLNRSIDYKSCKQSKATVDRSLLAYASPARRVTFFEPRKRSPVRKTITPTIQDVPSSILSNKNEPRGRSPVRKTITPTLRDVPSSILSNKNDNCKLPASTFFQTTNAECDEIAGVMKIYQHTINDMCTLSASVGPEMSSRFQELCASMKYLHNYSAGLITKHQKTIKEWERKMQN